MLYHLFDGQPFELADDVGFCDCGFWRAIDCRVKLADWRESLPTTMHML